MYNQHKHSFLRPL